jgi:small nuclear ribonucleoprotein (snRNP)-like protein
MQSGESNSTDDLDFFSPNFNPLKALNDPLLQPPLNVKPLDLLHHCRALLPTTDPNYSKQVPILSQVLQPKNVPLLSRSSFKQIETKEELVKIKKEQHPAEVKKEQFPVKVKIEQFPVEVKREQFSVKVKKEFMDDDEREIQQEVENIEEENRDGENKEQIYSGNNALTNQTNKKYKGDILKKIAVNAQGKEGPLLRLYEYFVKKSIIKVILRGGKQIRGRCEGQLIAFDKHWNLILVNVEEHYRVREILPVSEGHILDNTEVRLNKEKGIEGEDIEGEDYIARWIWKTRKIKQLLIKGDSVVLISHMNEKEL